MLAAIHPDQERRIAALRDYAIVDTPKESDYDDIVKLASAICATPMSLISFVDGRRQWFKASIGIDAPETPLTMSVCSHAILGEDMLVIPDTTADPRTADNPLTVDGFGNGSAMRFYAGAVLRTPEGLPLGTLCVLDSRPRQLTEMQTEALRVLGSHVMKNLDLRLALRQESEARRSLAEALKAREELVAEIDHRVKNSLAMVSALLRLQRQRAASPETAQALDQAATRIGAISSLHQELYESGSFDSVGMAAFGARIRALLEGTLPPNVSISATLEDARLPYKHASAVGALINEFATNSAKHAFPEGGAGQVSVRGRCEQGRYMLDLADDGVGMPSAGAAPARTRGSGLGARLIDASIAQLGARRETPPAGLGARLSISFPLDCGGQP